MRIIYLLILIFSSVSLDASTDLDGKELFKKNCKACHSLDTRLVGPALEGVTERRDSMWIYKFILGSQAMVNAGDPTAVELFNEYNQIMMPNQTVSHDEITAILSYIKSGGKADITVDGFIPRPAVVKIDKTPLSFDQYGFWIPYTAVVFLIIGMLYYLVEQYTLFFSKRENSDSLD